MNLRNSQNILIYALLSSIAVVLTTPLLYMLSIALSSEKTVAENAFTIWPKEWYWANFAQILFGSRIPVYLKNSITICVFAVIGQVFVSSFVAYGFARLRAPGKSLIFMVLLATMMIPQEVTMIPQFLIYRQLHMINTLFPLILPNFFGGAFNIFLLRQSIMRISFAFDEAAQIEGANYLHIWWYLILPMLKPIAIAVSIFTFSWNWGWFTGPLIYLNSPDKYPLALGLYFFTQTSNQGAIPPWNLIMVTAVILALPMLLVYSLGQKYVYSANIGLGSTLR